MRLTLQLESPSKQAEGRVGGQLLEGMLRLKHAGTHAHVSMMKCRQLKSDWFPFGLTVIPGIKVNPVS